MQAVARRSIMIAVMRAILMAMELARRPETMGLGEAVVTGLPGPAMPWRLRVARRFRVMAMVPLCRWALGAALVLDLGHFGSEARAVGCCLRDSCQTGCGGLGRQGKHQQDGGGEQGQMSFHDRTSFGRLYDRFALPIPAAAAGSQQIQVLPRHGGDCRAGQAGTASAPLSASASAICTAFKAAPLRS